MKARVLLADDDAALRTALVDRLRFWGHEVVEAADGNAALEIGKSREFDLILLDLSMPGRPGMEVLQALREAAVPADVVVLTAHGSIETAVEAIRMGAADFYPKPADFELLRAAVDRALVKRRLARVNHALADRVSEISGATVFSSPQMREVVEVAVRAAQSNATVLLTGESGTGKQVLAELIHQRSPRKQGPFVYVNCVAIPAELVETTLFGNEKGAYTTAVGRKQGRLEAAYGGTAFLDEIGDMPLPLQSKLLHFLETGEFERVGGTQTITVDCRIVAATNRDLAAEVQAGRFREDLYYRLNVIRLHLPPLRERPGDVRPLALEFLARQAAELKRGALELHARTLEMLESYAWPGNVRQLKNAIERMAVLAAGSVLTPDLLPPEILGNASSPPPGAGPGDGDRDTVLPYKEAVRNFKRAHVERALAAAGGNQTRAAEVLGLQRTFLNRLVKEFGL